MAGPPDPKQFEEIFEQMFGPGGLFEKKPSEGGAPSGTGAAPSGAPSGARAGARTATATAAGGAEILRIRLPLSFRQRERGGVHKLRVRWDSQATRVTVRVPPNTRRGAMLRLRGVHVATRAFDVHVAVDDPTLADHLRRPIIAIPLATAAIALLGTLFYWL